MSSATEQKKLYQEFREYQQLSEDEKALFREKIEQEALERSESEKALIGQAIQQNVEELRIRLEQIKAKIESSALHSH
ncbi:MAG: hypothetical protein U0Y10_06335 [Spirosomataceae bacterium]